MGDTFPKAIEAQKKAEEDARKKVASFVSSSNRDVEWLERAFVTQEGSIAYLRQLLEEVRELAIVLAQRARHQLTVHDAHLLHCCRVCLQPPLSTGSDNPFVMDYGAEFAHKACVTCPTCGQAKPKVTPSPEPYKSLPPGDRSGS